MTTPDPSLYEKAASIIEQTNRLAHGAFSESVIGDGDRPRILCYCTTGAVNVAAGREADDCYVDEDCAQAPDILALAQHMSELPVDDPDEAVAVIGFWNDGDLDNNPKTAADAVTLLREFAAELRAAA